MIYRDRAHAAGLLAGRLRDLRGQNPLVLAIPRGSVTLGRILADELDGELDVVLVRKLRAPDSPEFAVGSVDETGWTYFAAHAREAGADEAYLAKETAAQLELLHRRRALYTPARPPVDRAGRIAIVVDDGIATGACMIAALHAVRAKNPAALVCAVPVAPPASVEHVRPYADQLVCLQTPREFLAVGQFYRQFPQVEDAEVVALLERRSLKREVPLSH